MTPKDVIALAKENNVKVVDIRYMDFIGTWQHFSIPVGELSESVFDDGLGFDGSSMRAWQNIDNSDMIVIPEASTAKIDPFFKVPTLAILGNIHDPITQEPYTRDPRGIAKKVEQYLKSTGIGDTIYVGPEPEFFIFSNIRYSSEPHASFFEIDSPEAHWNTGSDEMPNLGYKIRPKGGYFPLPPNDQYQDMRTEMMLTLEDLGIEMECQHHEVATAGQSEIDLRFDSLLKMGDKLAWFKYVLRNVAAKYGHTVTFMPKPLYGDNGTGMHTHMSFWKDGNPLFAGLDLTIHSGDRMALVGRNGSGKSTMLKLAGGILKPTEGVVDVGGRVTALIELGAGFHIDLTGRENVFLNGSILGFSRQEMRDRFDEIVSFAELEQFIDAELKRWSTGMVMRLGFAIATSVNPDVLITDEILAVGDESFQHKCLRRIRTFREEGGTILFVSHDMHAVRELCERSVWLDHGAVQMDGASEEVVAGYLASGRKDPALPAMSVAREAVEV